MPAPDNTRFQIEQVYRRMAEAGYRPAAPSDGFGGITVSEDQLDLQKEAADYAAKWWDEEDSREYFIGVPDMLDRGALILTVEAARLLCGGGRDLAAKLLKIAADEAEMPR